MTVIDTDLLSFSAFHTSDGMIRFKFGYEQWHRRWIGEGKDLQRNKKDKKYEILNKDFQSVHAPLPLATLFHQMEATPGDNSGTVQLDASLKDPNDVKRNERFVLELEFVQALGNPSYLACTNSL